MHLPILSIIDSYNSSEPLHAGLTPPFSNKTHTLIPWDHPTPSSASLTHNLPDLFPPPTQPYHTRPPPVNNNPTLPFPLDKNPNGYIIIPSPQNSHVPLKPPHPRNHHPLSNPLPTFRTINDLFPSLTPQIPNPLFAKRTPWEPRAPARALPPSSPILQNKPNRHQTVILQIEPKSGRRPRRPECLHPVQPILQNEPNSAADASSAEHPSSPPHFCKTNSPGNPERLLGPYPPFLPSPRFAKRTQPPEQALGAPRFCKSKPPRISK